MPVRLAPRTHPDSAVSSPAKCFAEWVKDAAGLERVMREVIQMTKLDLAKLQKAFAGSDERTVRPQPSSFISKDRTAVALQRS